MAVATRRGWCDTHYRRWLRRGDVITVLPHGRVKGTCAVSDCGRQHAAKGYCDMHYRRWLQSGDPLKLARNLAPEGTLRKDGYRVKTVGSKQRQVHVMLAQHALGKPLPAQAVVHHADGNPSNNAHENLVICPDAAYHALIHKRTRAYNASGHADYGYCPHCKTYSDTGMLRKSGNILAHDECLRAYWVKQYYKR